LYIGQKYGIEDAFFDLTSPNYLPVQQFEDETGILMPTPLSFDDASSDNFSNPNAVLKHFGRSTFDQFWVQSMDFTDIWSSHASWFRDMAERITSTSRQSA
jgi:hypothetical protein